MSDVSGNGDTVNGPAVVPVAPGWFKGPDGYYPPTRHPDPEYRAQYATAPATPLPADQSQAAPPPAPLTVSDVSEGPGWWQATDQKWYPPERHPNYQPAPPPPPPGPAPMAAAAPPPPQPAAKKELTRRPLFWILLVIVLLCGGCIGIVAAVSTSVDHQAHVQHTVVYSVTGTGSVNNVTYATVQEGNGQQGESQVTNVSLPWTKTITASGLFTAFTVSGTVGVGGGSITCTIKEDGKVLNTNTASGAFATATCNATGTS